MFFEQMLVPVQADKAKDNGERLKGKNRKTNLTFES